MRSLPARVGLAEKAPMREACNGDSRHFCRHAADQVLDGLSLVSPLSPTKLQPCSSTTKLMRYRSPQRAGADSLSREAIVLMETKLRFLGY